MFAFALEARAEKRGHARAITSAMSWGVIVRE
jgi:hypothetical protein